MSYMALSTQKELSEEALLITVALQCGLPLWILEFMHRGADDPNQYLDTRSAITILNNITGGQHTPLHNALVAATVKIFRECGFDAKSSGVPRLGVEDRLEGDGVVADRHISSHRLLLITFHPAVGDRQPVTWDTQKMNYYFHRSTRVVNAEAVQEVEGLKNSKYLEAYQQIGYAFFSMVGSTLGKMGGDTMCSLQVRAHHVVSTDWIGGYQVGGAPVAADGARREEPGFE